MHNLSVSDFARARDAPDAHPSQRVLLSLSQQQSPFLHILIRPLVQGFVAILNNEANRGRIELRSVTRWLDQTLAHVWRHGSANIAPCGLSDSVFQVCA